MKIRRIIFFFILLMLISFLFFYPSYHTPSFPLLNQIVISYPTGEIDLIKKGKERYCRLSEEKICVTYIEYNGQYLILKWDDGRKEAFKQIGRGLFSFLYTVTEDMPQLGEWDDKLFLYRGAVSSFKITRSGRIYDYSGRYIGKILSQNTVLKGKEELSQNVIIENAGGDKVVFRKNIHGIYEKTNIDLNHPKKYRILLFTFSFKRPIFLSGHVLRMMNQTYDHFDFFVSIKGLNSWAMKDTILMEWSDFIESGRLSVQFDSNKKQFENLLDVLHSIDTTKYDYFCKVDDDDWYSSTYIEDIISHLNTAKNISGSMSGTYYSVNASPSGVDFAYANKGWGGSSICFDQRTLKELLKIENMEKKEIEKQYPFVLKNGVEWYLERHEDALIEMVARSVGNFVQRDYLVPMVIYNQLYPSINRPRYYNTFQKE